MRYEAVLRAARLERPFAGMWGLRSGGEHPGQQAGSEHPRWEAAGGPPAPHSPGFLQT